MSDEVKITVTDVIDRLTSYKETGLTLITIEDALELFKRVDQPSGLSVDNLNAIVTDIVVDILNNMPYDEFIETEPELNGSYGSSFTLEINTDFNKREFTRNFLDELNDGIATRLTNKPE
jgi:hypothetical protein